VTERTQSPTLALRTAISRVMVFSCCSIAMRMAELPDHESPEPETEEV